tara:strand:- start:21 stop:536 length:516 start_codon:yes stop_codon:yes gene_type:complete
MKMFIAMRVLALPLPVGQEKQNVSDIFFCITTLNNALCGYASNHSLTPLSHVVNAAETLLEYVNTFVENTQCLIGGCAGTVYGCCSDGVTAKTDPLGLNCITPPEDPYCELSECLDNNRVVVSKHLSGSSAPTAPTTHHSTIKKCTSCNSGNNHELKKDLQRFVTEALAEM